MKINNSYSLWKLIKYGVPQGSVLGPALFKIFLRDLFFIIDGAGDASYTDDNTPYIQRKFYNNVLEKFECVWRNIFEWFFENSMKANPDKCNFFLKPWYEH